VADVRRIAEQNGRFSAQNDGGSTLRCILWCESRTAATFGAEWAVFLLTLTAVRLCDAFCGVKVELPSVSVIGALF
jgi:hypothetical protein